MEEKKPEVIPVQYIPVNYYEEDEIDLKELLLTIWRYKWFVVIFTFVVTLAAAIYAFTKTPIYEIKANILPGRILWLNLSGSMSQQNLIPPYKLIVFINSTFDMSRTEKKLPKVNAELNKKNKKIITITIQDISNQKDLNEFSNIINNIRKTEKPLIEAYKKNIQQKISILLDQIEILKNKEKNLEQILKQTKDPQLLNIYLQAIKDTENNILSLNLKIKNLKLRLSPFFIQPTKVIGKIEQYNHPVKPKKKLIIVIAFITGLILSIFLVFFIEFVKSFKENK